MRKWLAIFGAILLIVLLIVSLSQFINVIKPFYESGNMETTAKTVSIQDDLEYQQKLQIDDFILSISGDFSIAIDEDGDEETIYLRRRNRSEEQFANFKLQGAKLKKMLIITEHIRETFDSKGSKSFNIPMFFQGENVKNAVITLSSSENEVMNLVIEVKSN